MKREKIRAALSVAPVWIGAAAGAALLSPLGATALGSPDREAAAVVALTAALFCHMTQGLFTSAEAD